MFSAGQYVSDPRLVPQGTQTPPPNYWGQPQWPGMQGYGGMQGGATGMPMVQMLQQPGGMNLNFNADLDPDKAAAMADRQQKLGEITSYMNGGIALMNGITSWVALGLQNEQMGRYYDYMTKVADDSRDIAMEQINLQEKGMDHESSMMEEKSRHEQELARIESKTQIRLAKIADKGKTDRAGIFAANNAFTKDYSNYGSPIG